MDKWLIKGKASNSTASASTIASTATTSSSETTASTATTSSTETTASTATSSSLADAQARPVVKKIVVSSSGSRPFNVEWEGLYFVILNNLTPFCLICNQAISVCKVYNIKRHYSTLHRDHVTLFPIGSNRRREKLDQLKKTFLAQRSDLRRSVNESDVVTLASFHLVWLLAKKGRSFTDGELFKSCIEEAMAILLQDQNNKTEIMNRINKMQLSRRTFVRRMDDITGDLIAQLKSRLQKCSAFSLALDESTDICGTSQLCIWIRYLGEDLVPHEDLLTLSGMHDRTRGEDIVSILFATLENYNIFSNIVSITTDGAPAMIGRKVGVVALMKQRFPNLLSFHCIIHQQSLCAKASNQRLQEVMDTVTLIVNIIRTKALYHRQFKAFLEDLDTEYGDVILHADVRWLSRGKVLHRFLSLLPEINDFLASKNITEYDTYLCDIQWVRDLSFMADLTQHLNTLILKLQGKTCNLVESVSAISAFMDKLKLFTDHLLKDELRHFPQLQKSVSEEPQPKLNGIKYATWVREISNNFNSRFQDFKKISLFTTLVADISAFPIEKIEEVAELLNICCVSLESELLEFKSKVNEKICSMYPNLLLVFQKIYSIFPSTYTCETSFSAMALLKSKLRSRITDGNLEHQLRCCVTSLSPDFKKLLMEQESQISH